jgi:Ran GTPase-activating protein (RanGAP) involved in mRNA processing and transport
LKQLNLGNNKIGDFGASWINKSIKGNSILQSLKLSENSIISKGILSIADSL